MARDDVNPYRPPNIGAPDEAPPMVVPIRPDRSRALRYMRDGWWLCSFAVVLPLFVPNSTARGLDAFDVMPIHLAIAGTALVVIGQRLDRRPHKRRLALRFVMAINISTAIAAAMLVTRVVAVGGWIGAYRIAAGVIGSVWLTTQVVQGRDLMTRGPREPWVGTIANLCLAIAAVVVFGWELIPRRTAIIGGDWMLQSAIILTGIGLGSLAILAGDVRRRSSGSFPPAGRDADASATPRAPHDER